MEQHLDLNSWKRILDQLETIDNGINQNDLLELGQLFKHLPSQVAPRLQREYNANILRSEKLLNELFDRIDLSNKPLLCSFLRLLRLYGYSRISQITYHVRRYDLAQLEHFPIHFPAVDKAKWYDMCPILPEAGTIGWKSIMNHGLVKEEPELLQTCLQLLTQKLHFYSIIINLEQYHHCIERIKKNGEKLVEKLFELIRDVAYDDESMIGIDSFLFNLLMPFTKPEQQAAIVDAIVQDLFKPYTIQCTTNQQEIAKIYELINCSIINHPQLQNFLISKLLEHFKCNIIRRKRRHSVESLEDGCVSLENILDDINCEKMSDLSEKFGCVEVTKKSFQFAYFQFWLETVDQILSQRTLKAINSLKLLATCSFVLVTASNIMDQNLIEVLTTLMAKLIDYTGPSRNDKLFNTLDSTFMINLTEYLSENTEIISSFDAPIKKFYKSYLNRYIRYCMTKFDKTESEKLAKFVNFICDKNMNKDTSHLLQYVYIHELANCLEGKFGNKLSEIYLETARICSKRLYKFIKRNLSIKIIPRLENGIRDEDGDDDVNMNDSELNCSNDTVVGNESKKNIVINALICILRIAIERKDQAMLDSYADLLLKLFDFISVRVEILIEVTKSGKSRDSHLLDTHIPKLLMLYRDHSELIEGYLNYNLIEKLANLLLAQDLDVSASKKPENMSKTNKKIVYNQIKTKLKDLEEKSNKSTDVYPLIINKQYRLVVDHSISNGDLKREKSCCKNYWNEMKTLYDTYSTIFGSCEINIYMKVLEKVVCYLEQCDQLDHPRVLFYLMIIETLIPKNHYAHIKNPGVYFDYFRDRMVRISTNLIRISKSVELGPSVHIFTNSGSHKTNNAIQCCTYANCIKIYTQIFYRYPPKLTNSLVTDAMQMCVSSNLIQYAKYSDRMHRFFIQLSFAVTGLLKSMFIDKKEEDTLRLSMPIFLTVFLNLIRCLIMGSDRQKLELLQIKARQSNGNGGTTEGGNDDDINDNSSHKNKEYETQLELLALDIGRILNNLSLLKVKMVEYAPHLISTYVKDIQRASCPDFVKLHLNEGIFRIFNVVDAHQKERLEELVEAGVQRKTTAGRASGSLFEMIHARLDQASREIFKNMHDDYNRFHRYQGKC